MNLKNVVTFSLFLLFLGLGGSKLKAQKIDGETIIGEQLSATRYDFTEILSDDWKSTDSTIYIYNDKNPTDLFIYFLTFYRTSLLYRSWSIV